jgi:benzoate-CoA ligase family protein
MEDGMPEKRRLSWGEMDLRAVTSPDELPREFNMAAALLDRHVVAGHGSRTALLGPAGNLTYEQLYRLTNQAGNAIRSLGIEREQRVLLLLRDSPEFFASFLGAMKIGAIPVALNTFAHPSDYEFFIRHSRASLLIAESEFLPPLEPFLWRYNLRALISVRGAAPPSPRPAHRFEEVIPAQSPELEPAPTHPDEPSHWVYSSGSTGEPKGTVHLHRNTMFAIEPYVRHVTRMTPDDISFSIARLFFSYGLANSLFMPLWVGAASVLLPERPEPQAALDLIEKYKATLFYSVPTAYNRMLRENLDLRKLASVRLCVSAGEALPAPIFEEWQSRTGLQILDGVGSTEFGYIFLTNRPDDVAPGASGKILPGHRGRLVDAEGNEVGTGKLGELLISSHAFASYYWRNHAASKKTFLGEWLRTGDQYVREEQGNFIYQGRTDDLFKSGGIWVSPVQVESTLLEHAAVAEVSVVAERDSEGLEKPVAYVVLKRGFEAGERMERELRQFTRDRLAVYKCPKAFHFTTELPKTATGKIQRFKLRAQGLAETKPGSSGP